MNPGLDTEIEILEVSEGLDSRHLHRICEIERSSFSDPWTEISFREIAEGKTGYVFLTALSNGEPVGFGCMYTVLDEAQIMNIAVLPEKRKQGIGIQLMSRMISEAKKRRSTVVMLEVRESNVPAITLYESFGFYKVGMRKNYYRNPVENAILMNKNIVDLF